MFFLQIQSINIMYPNKMNMIVVPITKIIASIQGKGWKKMLFLQIQSVNIMYPNKMNMIVVPITEIIASIQVCIIWWMNFD